MQENVNFIDSLLNSQDTHIILMLSENERSRIRISFNKWFFINVDTKTNPVTVKYTATSRLAGGPDNFIGTSLMYIVGKEVNDQGITTVFRRQKQLQNDDIVIIIGSVVHIISANVDPSPGP